MTNSFPPLGEIQLTISPEEQMLIVLALTDRVEILLNEAQAAPPNLSDTFRAMADEAGLLAQRVSLAG